VSQSEQELTRSIIDALNAYPNVWVWRNNVGTSRSGGRYVRFGKVGSGDIVGILRGGRHFELEVKLPDGKWKTTKEQEDHGLTVNKMGGVWAVVTSVAQAITTMEEALKWGMP